MKKATTFFEERSSIKYGEKIPVTSAGERIEQAFSRFRIFVPGHPDRIQPRTHRIFLVPAVHGVGLDPLAGHGRIHQMVSKLPADIQGNSPAFQESRKPDILRAKCNSPVCSRKMVKELQEFPGAYRPPVIFCLRRQPLHLIPRHTS